jgi:hypothetical protein
MLFASARSESNKQDTQNSEKRVATHPTTPPAVTKLLYRPPTSRFLLHMMHK